MELSKSEQKITYLQQRPFGVSLGTYALTDSDVIDVINDIKKEYLNEDEEITLVDISLFLNCAKVEVKTTNRRVLQALKDRPEISFDSVAAA